MNKNTLIVAGIAIASIIFLIAVFGGANNRAVTAEEQILGAKASIEAEEKRRVDLIYNLVDTVEQYADYESSTLKAVVEARAKASSTADIAAAQMAFNAVAEAYPELQADEQYKTLMNELSMTENRIAEMRNNYNIQVRSYNKLVRSFPNNLVLGVMGYEKIDETYLEFNAPSDAPQNLFDNK